MRRYFLLLLLVCLSFGGWCADGPAFDLAGPKVDVHVKRGEVTLPIGETPNLLPGDRLWIHPDFPESQSEHYVLIVAFLRGSTNPPPPDWFTRVETRSRQAREEGVFVTVPTEAQQAVVFLAPETGGGFNTLRKAVHDRPGAFVRATQDLQAASWERMRLDVYLDEVKTTSQSDPKLLKERSALAARSLGIRLDQACFDRPIDQQASCLTQHQEGLVLDDANAQSMVMQLASGSTGDLMNQLSYAPMVGGGLYSPYVGAIVDTAKILASLHTAHFQYIPALALPTKDELNLRLNVPPSFRDPKSVVVIALPPVGPGKPPALHPVDPAEMFCTQKPSLTLPAEGGPLVYSTQLAHDLKLHIETKTGPVDLPVRADPWQGGLVFDKPLPALPDGELTGVLQGKWGFDDWEGPRFHLRAPEPGQWTLAAGDQSALVVGREDTLHIEGKSSLCVDRLEEQAGSGDPLKLVKLVWKATKPGTLEVTMPLKDASPGPVSVNVFQFGMEKPDTLKLNAYAEAASLDRLTLSAGDKVAQLKGTRLDEVAKVTLNGVTWTPGELSRDADVDKLSLTASGSTAGLEPGVASLAKVELRDGRILKAPVTVNPPRPEVELLSKGTQEAADTASPVRLGSRDDLPLNSRLVFFIRTKVPATFPRTEQVEVAAADLSFHTTLSLADGSLMLEDAKTAIATLDPLSRFGSSAFGPLQARAVSANGVAGDWLALGTLVRVPGFKELRCPRSVNKPCALTGSDLFLATSVGDNAALDNATDVPPDFTGTQLTVPHPANGMLYVRLRDDPQTVQTVTLPVMPMTPAQAAPVPVTAATAPAQPVAASQPGARANATPAAPETTTDPAQKTGP
ncbi:MAG: hypothetical protein ABSG51_06235 [Terracidiphilus sp.]|jgi:hypothetical protein